MGYPHLVMDWNPTMVWQNSDIDGGPVGLM